MANNYVNTYEGRCQIAISAKKKIKQGSDGGELEGGWVLDGLALLDQVSFQVRPEGQEGKSQAKI